MDGGGGGSSPPPAKKMKDDDESVRHLKSLRGFRMDRVLRTDTEKKTAVVVGKFEGKGDDESDAIVSMEKLPFKNFEKVLDESTALVRQFRNDCYSAYDASMSRPEANAVKINVIWPATRKHVEKFSEAPHYIINETPALYNFLTLPAVEADVLAPEWIDNVLNHKKEVERIIYEDEDPESGFIIIPDFKWSTKSVEDLYCLAVVHQRGIKSIRDLNRSHLPMLRKLYRDGPKAIEAKFGVPVSKMRMYFHYQPSYYHLHVHYSHIDHRPPGIFTEKSHMLSSVISNIEKNGSHYSRATIPFAVSSKAKIFKSYEEAGYKFEPGQHKKPEVGKVIEFLKHLGKAKHEPCGEHWSTSFGDGAWRMAVMAICLPTNLDRKRIIKIALASSFTSLGKETDQNSTWAQKLKEVREVLTNLLPLNQAATMYDLFVTHVNARRGLTPRNEEEQIYRKLLEMEEVLLMWEELDRDDQTAGRSLLLKKMVEIGFPGHEKYEMYNGTTDFNKLLSFFIQISQLRHLKRTGWVRCGVRDPERVSGHMFRMAVMAMLLEDQETESCRKILGGSSVILSIVHDMAECIIGDVTPQDPMSEEEKHQKEMEAMLELVKGLPLSTHSKEYFHAFKRYEDQSESDPEARLTKDLDKFDMVLQAYEYELKKPKDKQVGFLQQFFDSTQNFFKHPTVKEWDKFVREERKLLLK